MSASFRNYYETLGVSKSATPDEIKRAFRKLARKHHPDLAKDKKAAEEKFKEINEAYEVLGNPENRKKYDTYGDSWSQAGAAGGYANQGHPGFQGAAGTGGMGNMGEEFHFGGTGFSDFFEQFFGTRRGRAYGGGSNFEEMPQRGSDVEADILVTLNEVLHGATRQISFRRNGTQELKTYTIKIPQGVHEGQRIRLAGQGEQGGNRGTPGDLYLRVKIQQHPDFHLEENNITCDIEVPAWKAVLGGEQMVPTLEGRIKLKIPAGTANGKRFRIPNRGLPDKTGKRGDFYTIVEIIIPTHPSEKEKELWQELRSLDTHSE